MPPMPTLNYLVGMGGILPLSSCLPFTLKMVFTGKDIVLYTVQRQQAGRRQQ